MLLWLPVLAELPGFAQWPLLFASHSKVNTGARTQSDCWRNCFLLLLLLLLPAAEQGSAFFEFKAAFFFFFFEARRACVGSSADGCGLPTTTPWFTSSCRWKLHHIPFRVSSSVPLASGRSPFLTEGGSGHCSSDRARNKAPVVQTVSSL